MHPGNSAKGPLNPGLVFEMLQAHQRTAALKTAIDLDVFRAVGEGPGDVASIAQFLGNQAMRDPYEHLAEIVRTGRTVMPGDGSVEHAALRPGGRAATLEFVPNEDRVSPPIPAAFSMVMLASTVAGDLYAERTHGHVHGGRLRRRHRSPHSHEPSYGGHGTRLSDSE